MIASWFQSNGVAQRVISSATRRLNGSTQRRAVVTSNPTIWYLLVCSIGLIVLLPVASIFFLALTPSGNIWPHLLGSVLFQKAPLHYWVLSLIGLFCVIGGLIVGARAAQLILVSAGLIAWISGLSGLPGAVPQTLTLMVGVGVVTLIIGSVTAWLVTMYRFPGREVFDWLLLVPLAMPTYIIAFCYVEIFDYSGTAQTALRNLLGYRSAADYWFPQIRSSGGAIFVMSMVLYPYVYMAARASFIQQSICVLEVARTLGRGPVDIFYSIAVPLARPALVAGVALALMECLNDIGAVEYFGVNTLTLSIYSTWLERSSLPGAAQIASIMLIFVVALFVVERAARDGQSYHHTTGRYRPISIETLKGMKAWVAASACFVPIMLGFLLPVFVLLQSVFLFFDDAFGGSFWSAARNSVLLSSAAACLAVLLALLLSYGKRVLPTNVTKFVFRFTSLGYAIPGTVLAIGVLIPLASFDNFVDSQIRHFFGYSTGLVLSGSAFALLLAYTVRFMSISNSNLDAGFNRISPSIDAAARSLGAGSLESLRRVHLPLLRPAFGAALLLVFVDSMKELPATLLLRPFNFETLATHVYNYASLEQFEEAGVASLMIVAIGLVPVILLSRTVNAARPGGKSSHSVG